MSYIPRDPVPHDVVVYRHDNGREPFSDWLASIRNPMTIAIVHERIDRLQQGQFGDCRALGDGLIELRIHRGPGIRIYLGLGGKLTAKLLWGGTKRGQSRDIARARAYWKMARRS